MDNDFRISLRLESVTLADEKHPQFPEVVNLTIEDDPDGAVLIREWLVTSAEIDDREPPVSQAHARSPVESLIIGASMAYGTQHGADKRRINACTLIKIQFPADSAHG
jgi:hypothetical protein